MTGADLAPHFSRLQRALAARPAALAERDEPYREAAVALVLRAIADDDLEVLLMRRAARDGDPWSGQVGLPGGRWSPDDASLQHTALRETFEEVGIDLHTQGLVLGQLDELRPRTPVLPPIIVRPFVCALTAEARIVANHEVAELRWVRLGELFHPATRVHTSVRVRDFQMKVDAYQLGDFTVWGMTERILATFEEIWR